MRTKLLVSGENHILLSRKKRISGWKVDGQSHINPSQPFISLTKTHFLNSRFEKYNSLSLDSIKGKTIYRVSQFLPANQTSQTVTKVTYTYSYKLTKTAVLRPYPMPLLRSRLARIRCTQSRPWRSSSSC